MMGACEQGDRGHRGRRRPGTRQPWWRRAGSQPGDGHAERHLHYMESSGAQEMTDGQVFAPVEPGIGSEVPEAEIKRYKVV